MTASPSGRGLLVEGDRTTSFSQLEKDSLLQTDQYIASHLAENTRYLDVYPCCLNGGMSV